LPQLPTKMPEERETKAGQCVWGPIGRFGWWFRTGRSRVFEEAEVGEGKVTPVRVRLAIEAGLFAGGQSNISRHIEVKAKFDEFLGEACRGW